MEGNLTKDPILKTLTKLAVPIMASSFLGTLYNITDMAWIGLLGSKAVAGVGVGGMFTWLSRDLRLWLEWVDRCMWHSVSDVETEKRHTDLHRRQYSLSHLWEWHMEFFSSLFTRQMVGFFSACRCTGSCGGNVIYEDCLWADRIFFL